MKLLTSLFICAFALIAGDQLAPSKAPPVVSQRWLQDRAAHWRNVLRLNDWDIEIEALRSWQLTRSHWSEFIVPDQNERVVVIHVLDPRDYWKACRLEHRPEMIGREIQRDMEASIIHELVHLRLFVDPVLSKVDPQVFEMTVVRLTDALLNTRAK